MKLCIDCRHYEGMDENDSLGFCTRKWRNPVDGEFQDKMGAWLIRAHPGYCGPLAQGWEPHEEEANE